MREETQLAVVACIFIAFLVVPIGGCTILQLTTGIPAEYSTGERTGVVYKVSKKGLMFKTYEAEMNLGGMIKNSDGAAVVNIWAFSFTDPTIVKKVEDAAKNGNTVTIKYFQPWLMPFRDGSSGYTAIGIEDTRNK